MARLCFALAVVALAAVAAAENMNGVYEIGNPSGQGTYSTVYTDEYVEVLSPPLKTQYSEVYWTMMDAVPLPPALVQRFANKTMAITGYEADQVWASNGESVPIYYSYNHHFEAYVNGAFSSLEEHDDVTDAAGAYGGRGSHGSKYRHASISSDPRPNSTIPVGQWFSEGNGGEYRMSYHGYPRGYAQLIDSPTAFQIQPMQIDTHNRDYNGTGFRAGPLPRASAAPKDASYSGLLECPCTTRINKVIEITYGSQTAGECSEPVRNSTECYGAARTIGIPPAAITKNMTAADASQPAGCSLVPDGKGAYTALFNTPSGGQGAPCSGASQHVNGTISAVDGLVAISLDLDAKAASGGVATITLTGPAGVWFGVGFNASGMGDEPYTIIVNGTGGVQERKLADQAPGTQIASTVTVVSDTVSGKQRTVVMTRAFKGATPDHYTFDPSLSTNIPLILAAGNTPALAYHGKTKGTAQLTLTGVDAPTCICVAGMSGTINGLKFHKNCLPEPYGDLLRDHNPTCNVRDYEGGLSCCHHGWFLLDADQEIPAPVDEIQLKFRFYFQEYNASYHKNLIRLYYQTEAWSTEYDVLKAPAGTPPENTIDEISAHFKVSDMIKPCPTRQGGGCTGPAEKGIELVYAGAHCHAPSCLSVELYNADTGDLICRQVPGYGTDTRVFNEEGYLWIPPCVWGHEPGVLSPPFLSLDTNLMSIKRNNNTYTHYGEMASWQMRGLVV